MPVNSRIQLRRGTSTQWLNTLDILASGEMGYDTIQNNIKIGNGSDLWADLPWLVTSQTGEFVASTGTFDVIALDTEYEGQLSQGQISWNSTEGTLNVGLTDSVSVHVGEHRFFRIRNETGNTLYKGQVVYATGIHSNGLIEPNLYVADGSVREVRFMGSVLEDVNHNNNGFVVDFGHIEDIDLDGSATNFAVGDETWSAGDILYVHPTAAGKLTNVAPAHEISVAIILDAGNGNGNGRMFVRPTSYGHLDDNHDVNVSGLVDNNLLVWNSGLNYWEPTTSMTFDGTTLHTDTDGITAIFGRNNAQTVGGKVRIYVDDNDTAGSVQAIKAFNAKTTGTNYGINATAHGLGATKNVGLYGWAAQATTNWGLWVNAGDSIFDDKVGINTYSPTYDLHVNGSGYVSNSFYVDGSVGINTTSPNATLHVYNSTPSGTIFNAEGTNGSLFSVVDNLSGVLMSVNTIAGLPVLEVNSDYSITAGRFNQNDFVITSSGDIGMGIAAPSGKLHVAGEIYVDNLKLDGNTLSSTNSNGNVYITPNGTGGVAGGSSATVTGSYAVVGGGQTNTASGARSTVSGGQLNCATANYSTVSGGYGNCSTGLFSTSAGVGNRSTGYASVVGGGGANCATGGYSTVAGGQYNCSYGFYSFIGAGKQNVSNTGSYYDAIVAGTGNATSGSHSFIGAGTDNRATATRSAVVGGYANEARATCSFVGGGAQNVSCGIYAGIVAGSGNNICTGGSYSFIGGGRQNTASGGCSFIGAGSNNDAACAHSFVGAGVCNRACNSYAFVGGGYYGFNYGGVSAIAGGQFNTICSAGSFGFIGAGQCNKVCACAGVVAGGEYNCAVCHHSSVTGGAYNFASGDYSAVVAGSGNVASGACSFIGGGNNNTSSSCYSSVLGGKNNTVSNSYGGAILGGASNSVGGWGYNAILTGYGNCTLSNSYNSVIAGGSANCTNGDFGFIGNGDWHSIEATRGFIGGGLFNRIMSSGIFDAWYGTIVNGEQSTIFGSQQSFIGNGQCNLICSTIWSCNRSVIVGGGYNCSINSSSSFIGGGDYNSLSSSHTVVGGGKSNVVNAGSHCSVIAGGIGNVICANSTLSTIGGGNGNYVYSSRGTIAGGCNNKIYTSSTAGTVSGGYCNQVLANLGFIGGGQRNITNGCAATVAGGQWNCAACGCSSVLGGALNVASGDYSAVVAGSGNIASGACSFIGGGEGNISRGGSVVGGGTCNCNCGFQSVIGGGLFNRICVGSSCSVISGGHCNQVFCGWGTVAGGHFNTAACSKSTVGGGSYNRACGDCSTVSGGYMNCVMGCLSTIAGGCYNCAYGCCGFIGGGYCNKTYEDSSSVVGGCLNWACATKSTIVGGACNCISASGIYSSVGGGFRNNIYDGTGTCDLTGGTIGGGYGNNVMCRHSTIGGGYTNRAYGDMSTVAGGRGNYACGNHSSVAGGLFNYANGACSSVGGGCDNCAIGGNSVVGGGRRNCSTGNTATIAGGLCNISSNNYSFIGGGSSNQSNAVNSTVAGGLGNFINTNGQCSFIGGGYCNSATQYLTTISGGCCNATSSPHATVGGGRQNTASCMYTTIAGGCSNTASHAYATVVGGQANCAAGARSFIGAGRNNCVTSLGTYSNILGGCSNSSSGAYSAILGGKNNSDGGCSSVFILGTGITATSANTTYTQKLNVSHTTEPSGTLFNVEGSNGSLFSVVDNLSGVLMSVNNNAGLPVFEVYDDDSIVAGRFAQNDFVVSSSGNVGIGTDSPVTKLDVSGVITATDGDSDEWNEAYDWVAASGGLPYVTGVGTANQVAFFNGTDSITSESNLYWDSGNNRLGIGTTNPNATLHVANVPNGGALNGMILDNIRLSTGYGAGLAVQPMSSESVAFLFAANVNDQTDSAKTIFRITDNSYSTPWLNIVGGGNVGIGTSSPTYKLHVAGDISANANNVYAGGFAIYGDANNKLTKSGNDFTLSAGQTTTDIHLGYYNGGTLNKVLTVDSSADRVGILNTAPSYTLDVAGDGRFTSDLDVQGGITASGNVGISRVPSYDLDVSGVIRASVNDSNPALRLVRDGSNGYLNVDFNSQYSNFRSQAGLRFYTAGGGAVFGTANNGNFGINTLSPAYTLDVNGTSNLGGNVIVGGNLTVNGTTISTNVDTIEIQDPIITLGLTSGNIVTNDSYDRGIAMVTNDGTAFMGWDNSADKFVMLASGVATNGSGNYDPGTWGQLDTGASVIHQTTNNDSNGGLTIKSANDIYSHRMYADGYDLKLDSNGSVYIGIANATSRNLYINSGGSTAWHIGRDGIKNYTSGSNVGAGIYARYDGYLGFNGLGSTYDHNAISLHQRTGHYDWGLALHYRASGVGVGLTKGLVLDNRGRVGINDETPSYQLDVNGTTQIIPTAATDTLILGRSTGYASVTSTTSNELILDSDGAYTSLNHYSSDDVILGYGGGNVGIGTATPSQKLHIKSSDAAHLYTKLENGHANYETYFLANCQDGGYAGFGIGSNSSDAAIIVTDQAKYRWYFVGTPKMELSSYGNLSIGKSTPSYALDIRSSSPVINLENSSTGGSSVIRLSDTAGRFQIGKEATTHDLVLESLNGGIDESMRIDYGDGSVTFNETGADMDFRVEASGQPNALFVNGANGNVGIGTASTSYQLQVQSTSNNIASLTNGGYYGLDVTRNNTSYAAINIKDAGGRSIKIGSSPGAFGNSDAYLSDLANGLGYGVTLSTRTDADNNHMSLRARGDIAFYTNTGTTSLSERVRIKTDGDVGIGTTAPSAKLHVNASTGYDGILIGGNAAPSVTFDGTNTAINWRIGNAGSDGNKFTIASSTSTSDEHFVVTSGGYIGIGISSPDTDLHVQQASPALIDGSLTNLSNHSSVALSVTVPDANVYAGSGISIALGMNDRGRSYISNIWDSTNKDQPDLVFHTTWGGNGIIEALRIKGNGKIGVGTTSPTQQLDIRYPAGGGMALLKSTDANDGLLFGDMAYSQNDTYQGIKHAAMTGSTDYMMISDGAATYISAKSANDVFIRNGGNNTNCEIRLSSTEVVVNDNSSNLDFRVESNNNANMLFVDGVSDKVGIGTGSPAYTLDVYSNVNAAGAIRSNNAYTGTGATASFWAQANNAQGYFHVNSSARTSTLYGVTMADYVEVRGGTNSAGLMLGNGALNTPIIFGNNDTERMRIAAGGNVGIGTTSPSYILDVAGTGNFSGDIYAAGNVGVGTSTPNATLHAYSATSGAMILNVEGTYGSLFSVRDNLSGVLMNVNTVAGLPALEIYDDYSLIAGRYNQNDFVISSGGNVGIGTASPHEKLHIEGDVTLGNTAGSKTDWNRAFYVFNDPASMNGYGLTLGGQASTNRWSTMVFAPEYSDIAFKFDGSNVNHETGGQASFTTALLIRGDNKYVGIGTENPISELDVSGVITANGGNSDQWNEAYDFIQASGLDGVGAASGVAFWTDSNTLSYDSGLTWDSGNNRLGLGITAPSALLHVNGSAIVHTRGTTPDIGLRLDQTYTTHGSLWIDTANGTMFTYTGYYGHKWATSTGEAVRITQNRDVGIGTTSPTQKLDVRYPDGGGMALLKSTDTNDGLLFGDMAYSTNNDYQGMKHAAMTGANDYMILSQGTNTYISAGTGGSVIMNAGGNDGNSSLQLTSTEVVINDQSSSRDFRVESNNNANMLFVDGIADKVGIGNASPAYTLDISGSTRVTGTGIFPNIVTTGIMTTSGWGYNLVISNDNGDGSVILRGTSTGNNPQGVKIYPGKSDNFVVCNSGQAPVFNLRGDGRIQGAQALWQGNILSLEGAAGAVNVHAGHIKLQGGNAGSHATYASNAGNVYIQGGSGNSLGPGSDGEVYIRNPSNVNMHIFKSDGNVGIGTTTPSQKLDVAGSGNFSGDVTISGHLSAATKSFLINHPTEEGKKLQYGSLESPYHGVRLTGRAKTKNGKCLVELPQYISSLVRDDENVNVQITNYKHGKTLYVDSIDVENNSFVVKCDAWFSGQLEFFWSFTAVRKDVKELQVEF